MEESAQQIGERMSIGKTLLKILVPGTLAIPAIKEFSESFPSPNEDFYFPMMSVFAGLYALTATAIDIGKIGAYIVLANNLLNKT